MHDRIEILIPIGKPPGRTSYGVAIEIDPHRYAARTRFAGRTKYVCTEVPESGRQESVDGSILEALQHQMIGSRIELRNVVACMCLRGQDSTDHDLWRLDAPQLIP